MRKPKILFFDIETTPVKVWVFRTGKQWVNHSQIVHGERFGVICLAYKWLGEKKVTVLDWGLKRQNEAKMLREFRKAVESADVVIGQNSDAFDIKQINTQLLLHGEAPMAWPTTEDTRKMIRKHFYVTSSSLDYMSKLLTDGQKSPMHFQDWVDIIDNKCPKAFDKMKKYCAKDVIQTQKVWSKIASYCTPKAHRGLLSGESRDSCPQCGSPDRQKYGKATRRTGQYQRYQCKACAHVYTDSRKI